MGEKLPIIRKIFKGDHNAETDAKTIKGPIQGCLIIKPQEQIYNNNSELSIINV